MKYEAADITYSGVMFDINEAFIKHGSHCRI